MKITNVRTYNMSNALNAIPGIENSDSIYGISDYDDVKAYVIKKLQTSDKNLITRELINAILYQYKNGLCDFCVLGEKDLACINVLKANNANEFFEFIESIIINLTVEAPEEFYRWFELKDVWDWMVMTAPKKINGTIKASITTNYLTLRRIAEETQEFNDIFMQLPYGEQLIF